MRTKLITAAAALAAALSLAVVSAPAAEASSKAPVQNHCSLSITSDKHKLTANCNPPGTVYNVDVYCSWYSAGKGGTYQVRSGWISDGRSVTLSCGSAYVSSIGKYVWYK